MSKQNRQYAQLTPKGMYTIQALNDTGFSQLVIADTICKHKSTVSRGLSRNCCVDGYKVEHST